MTCLLRIRIILFYIKCLKLQTLAVSYLSIGSPLDMYIDDTTVCVTAETIIESTELETKLNADLIKQLYQITNISVITTNTKVMIVTTY